MNEGKPIEISSAYDFFEIVHAQNSKHLDYGDRGFLQYYRGQSKSEWELVPSICRPPLVFFERDLVQEYVSKRPNDYKDLKSKFSIISKMQHYGLATRLVDMTANPAVALFFSCNNNFDNDGEIFTFPTTREEVLEPIVSDMIMRFYIDEQGNFTNCDLLKYYQKCILGHKKEDVEACFYFLIGNEPRIATTEWISERMIRQSSAFLIFPWKTNNKSFEENRKDGLYVFLGKVGYEEFMRGTTLSKHIDNQKESHIKYHQEGSRYIVKQDYKHKILRELKTIGIFESFLFPELEYEGRSIVNEFLYLTQQ